MPDEFDRTKIFPPKKDRAAVLKELLDRETKMEDVPALVREVATVVIQISDEFETLSYVRSSIARMERTFLDYMEDVANFRLMREKREAEIAQTESLKHREAVNESNRKLKAIREQKVKIDTGEHLAVKDPAPAPFDYWAWFRDKILPTLVSTVLVIIVLSILRQSFGVAAP